MATRELTNTPRNQTRSSRQSGVVPANIMVPRMLLILSSMALLILGLVMIYSASSVTALQEYGDSAHYFKNQIIYAVVGTIVVIVLARIDYRFWESKFSWVLWAIEIVLLLFTAVFGKSGSSGAQRWISLGALGTLQPSEFAKIVVLISLGAYLVKYQEGVISLKRFLVFAGIIIVVPLGLIIAQPDLGTTVIVVLTVLCVLWFGEVDFKPILILIPVILVLVVIAIAAEPYRLKRVVTFFNPFNDPLGDGYQLVNSLYAFGSGGISGVGLGLSRQKFLYLPEAHTDFIFAVIGEELGLVGTLCTVALFLVFIYAGIQIARHAPTNFGRILAGSATSAIGLQAFLNMACTLGLFPVTGKPLPFISAGGSSLMATLILVGMILGVSYHSTSDSRAARSRGELRVYEGRTGYGQARGKDRR